jgi:predicted aspartyl protease
MSGRLTKLVHTVIFLLSGAPVLAASTSVSLHDTEFGTFHLDGELGHGVHTRFLLDTGSAYVVLSEASTRKLLAQHVLTPVRKLRAVLANHSSVRAQVYRLESLALGGGCVVRNLEVLAMPGADRDILGLSALTAVAPFTVHLDPSRLDMSCAPPALSARENVLPEGA